MIEMNKAEKDMKNINKRIARFSSSFQTKFILPMQNQETGASLWGVKFRDAATGKDCQ
jgi:hypothetical protein